MLVKTQECAVKGRVLSQVDYNSINQTLNKTKYLYICQSVFFSLYYTDLFAAVPVPNHVNNSSFIVSPDTQ